MITLAINPATIPNTATETVVKIRTRVGKALLTISSEGRLIDGSVTKSAAAGPTPNPNAIRVCIMGISAAVGITNSVPVTARSITVKILFDKDGPIVGNNHTRTAPNRNTIIR
jgi:hypothetical protein